MSNRTRIKMCGMTRAEDIRAACEAGTDAIGMIFYPPSPRFVNLAQAEVLAAAADSLVSRVALFVNADPGFVREVCAVTKADILQFHGDESPEYCQQFDKRYIKALRVKDSAQIESLIELHSQADAIMLDAYVEGIPGGTGKSFDWTLVPLAIRDKLLLAGGLTPSNVAHAVQQIRPYGVDVAGGLEIQPGIKSQQKIIDFAAAVRAADAAFNEISS